MMPTAYELAKKLDGVVEWAEGSNPVIDQMFADVGHAGQKDDVSWCAAFVGAMLKRSGLPHTGSLAARSYLKWGSPVALENAKPGDVVVFWRVSPNSWQGHVGFYTRHDANNIYVLGGNQSDRVSVAPYSRSRLLGVRRMEVEEPKPEGLLAVILRLLRALFGK